MSKNPSLFISTVVTPVVQGKKLLICDSVVMSLKRRPPKFKNNLSSVWFPVK